MRLHHVLVLIGLITPNLAGGRIEFLRRLDESESDAFRKKSILYKSREGVNFEETFNEDRGESYIPHKSEVVLHLHTRQNLEYPEYISCSNIYDLTYSPYYEPARPNILLIHGWKQNLNSDFNSIIRDAILPTHDVNLFIVDWYEAASGTYEEASEATPYVGLYVGEFINKMMSHYGIPATEFTLVGHGLGAHACGSAGTTTNGLLNTIVALDPAGPLFSLESSIDESDASFVQVIHTSSGVFGLNSSLGHADFYPNGGEAQPGCADDVTGECSHARAYELYGDSIKTGGFSSVRCNSYSEFVAGSCAENAKSHLGGFIVDRSATGDFYLETNERSSFSKD